MPSLWTIIAGMFFAAGLTFFTGTIIGIIRFPSFFTRMHAAGKADTLSSLLMILGFIVLELQKAVEHHETSHYLVCVKLVMIMGFIFVASPTATHALIDAGYRRTGGQEDREDLLDD